MTCHISFGRTSLFSSIGTHVFTVYFILAYWLDWLFVLLRVCVGTTLPRYVDFV